MDTILDNIPIDMFVSDIEENKPVEKPKKRKPPTRKYNTEETAWRRKPDGTYDNRPLDPNYYVKYVMTPVQCPRCHLMTRRGHINRHQRSANCHKIRSMILREQENTS